MDDGENKLQPSKKRAAGVQLSRDNPGLDDDEDTSENGAETFKRASDEVLASRKIVKVRRQQLSSVSSAAAPAPAPASNPFAAIRLVAPPDSAPPVPESKEAEQSDKKSENQADGEKSQSSIDEEKPGVNEGSAEQPEGKVDESRPINDLKDENESFEDEKTIKSVVDQTEADACETEASKGVEDDKKVEDRDNAEEATEKNETDNGEETTEKNEKDSFDEAAEKNAETSSFSSFQQLSSGQNAFSGLAGTGFSSTSFSFGSTTGSIFDLKTDSPFSRFGASVNGSSSIFGTGGASSTGSKTESSKFPSMQEVAVETGEENEKAAFTADAALFEFVDGSWKERGKGEVKVNFPTTGAGKARLVMRTRGNYRLILNASLFPDMKLTNMEKKGITFACVNSAVEGTGSLSTLALKFKEPSIVQDFRTAVMEHKSTTPVALKTPENSPKASDE